MDDVGQAGTPSGGQHVFGRGDVVVDEGLFVERADLGVVQHQRSAALEGLLPSAGPGEIRLDHLDVRVELSEDRDIRRMLVDPDDFQPLAVLEARDQVLADEAGGAGYDDPAFAVAGHVHPSIHQLGVRRL